ncbi:MAG TPA: DUF2934 domain-containing protein [Gammaproteobacteria bacterium]|nr:DUF2934 domain-containing protein [Gammaproteobacteria bacterium]
MGKKSSTSGSKSAASKPRRSSSEVAPEIMRGGAAEKRPETTPELMRAITSEERHAMIAERAYLRAEQRGFRGGDPLLDWLEGEREVDRLLERPAD